MTGHDRGCGHGFSEVAHWFYDYLSYLRHGLHHDTLCPSGNWDTSGRLWRPLTTGHPARLTAHEQVSGCVSRAPRYRADDDEVGNTPQQQAQEDVLEGEFTDEMVTQSRGLGEGVTHRQTQQYLAAPQHVPRRTSEVGSPQRPVSLFPNLPELPDHKARKQRHRHHCD